MITKEEYLKLKERRSIIGYNLKLIKQALVIKNKQVNIKGYYISIRNRSNLDLAYKESKSFFNLSLERNKLLSELKLLDIILASTKELLRNKTLINKLEKELQDGSSNLKTKVWN